MNRENHQTYLGLRLQYKGLGMEIYKAETEEDEDKAIQNFISKCQEIIAFCEKASAQESEEAWKNDWLHRGDYFKLTINTYESSRAHLTPTNQ